MDHATKTSRMKFAAAAFFILAAAGIFVHNALRVEPEKINSVRIATKVNQFVIHPASLSDIRYIAVGDSYSAGTGAKPEQSWPEVITKSLRAQGIKVALVANLGVDGWTTEDALTKEMPVYQSSSPQFATLMIGVNDTYRKTTPDEFRAKFVQLTDCMIKSLPGTGRVVAVTIPDFTVTPTGKGFASQNNAKVKIGLFNMIIKDEADKRGIPVVDVFQLSQRMATDQSLVAQDGLHPSAKEYALWSKQLEPVIYGLLKKNAVT